jgi:hypothetical protein
MAFTSQVKVQCCYWLAEFKFPVIVQRKFRQKYGRDPPDRHTIVHWQQHLLQHGTFERHGAGGRPRMTPEQVDMLENYAMPQVSVGYTFQRAGAPPHYWTPVTEYLNQHFAGRWIGRGGLIPCPLDHRI